MSTLRQRHPFLQLAFMKRLVDLHFGVCGSIFWCLLSVAHDPPILSLISSLLCKPKLSV
ncbi:hypothetical protein IF2G_08670 [Cordyceps javanica]|nr:hypothetical protein IF2G_08670 [Cordyceps javanica]